jgi:rhodanese-related sulfurtransferase
MKLRYTLGTLLMFLFFFSSCSSEDNGRKIEKMYRKYRQSFAEVPDKNLEHISKFKKEKVCIIDVREEKEYSVSMLKGAITKKEYYDNKEKYKDHMIIVYCTVGYRSGMYSRELLKERKNVFNLRGGILAWINDGGKLYKDEKETKTVSVYGKQWNLVPKEYKAVW